MLGPGRSRHEASFLRSGLAGETSFHGEGTFSLAAMNT